MRRLQGTDLVTNLRSLLVGAVTASLVASAVSPQVRTEIERPRGRGIVALGCLEPGQLVALTDAGVLFRVDASNGKAQQIWAAPAGREASDLASGFVAGKMAMVVLTSRPQGPVSHGALYGLTSSGMQLGEWVLPPFCGFRAVAMDIPGSRALLVNDCSSQVFAVDLTKPPSTEVRPLESRQRFPSNATISALAFDAASGALFAGDSVTGTLYRASLRGRGYTKVADGLGALSALALDPSSRTILAADWAGRRIFRVALAATTAARHVVAEGSHVGAAQALAVCQAQSMWVGRADTTAISELGFDGTVKRDLRLSLRPTPMR